MIDPSNQREISGVPSAAYMLADHLDAALAAGEDILSAGRQLISCDLTRSEQSVAMRSCVDLIKALELALITRTLKAREWSQRLVECDARFKGAARLFVGGTVPLTDALAEFADSTQSDFATGESLVAFFRSRGVIDSEAVGFDGSGKALITQTYRVCSRIEIGALLDMIVAYLDALEAHFVLFAPINASSTITGIPQSIDSATHGVRP